MATIFQVMGAILNPKPHRKNYVGQPPRFPTDDEVKAWLRSADSRQHNAMNVRKELRRRNPVRWNRMQGDFHWMQKQLKKMGLNPDDARWYL